MYVVSLKPRPTTRNKRIPFWNCTGKLKGGGGDGWQEKCLRSYTTCTNRMTGLGNPGSLGINSTAEALGLQRWRYLKPRNVIFTHRGCPCCIIWTLFSPGVLAASWAWPPNGGTTGTMGLTANLSSLFCGRGADLSLSRILLLLFSVQAPGQAEWRLRDRSALCKGNWGYAGCCPQREVSQPSGVDLGLGWGDEVWRQRPLPTRIISCPDLWPHLLTLSGPPFPQLDWDLRKSSTPCHLSEGDNRRSEKGKPFEALGSGSP